MYRKCHSVVTHFHIQPSVLLTSQGVHFGYKWAWLKWIMGPSKAFPPCDRNHLYLVPTLCFSAGKPNTLNNQQSSVCTPSLLGWHTPWWSHPLPPVTATGQPSPSSLLLLLAHGHICKDLTCYFNRVCLVSVLVHMAGTCMWTSWWKWWILLHLNPRSLG